MSRSRKRNNGQGLTEYLIIAGLVALLLIGVVTAFKEQIRVTIEGSEGAVDRQNWSMSHGGASPTADDDNDGVPNWKDREWQNPNVQ